MTDLNNPDELRQAAEARLAASAATQAERGPVDLSRLVHELQVHQIELEMQNSELATVRDQLEASLTRYTELYDFAPIGYFSLDSNGVILQLNLAGAQLLGLERGRLVSRTFVEFIGPEFRTRFSATLKRSLSSKSREVAISRSPEAYHPQRADFFTSRSLQPPTNELCAQLPWTLPSA